MSFATSRLPLPAPWRLALAVAAACAAPAALAQSALPPGVGVYVQNTIAGIGGASYASSGTVTIYSPGGLVIDPPQYTYQLTSPTTMPLGLTAATLSALGTNRPSGHATGVASATADLSGGVLRSTTSSTADVPYEGVTSVSARVITTSFMQDYVTFSVASAAGADVVVSAHLDGSYTLSDPIYASTSATMVVDFGGYFSYYGGANANGDYGYHGGVHGDFTSYSFSNESSAGYDFSGVLHVTDGERLRMSTGLYLDCPYSQCRFGNTGRIGLATPSGVSFTSDSGVFLSGVNAVAPVPEPETWALMLAGFATLGSLARRRRQGAVR